MSRFVSISVVLAGALVACATAPVRPPGPAAVASELSWRRLRPIRARRIKLDKAAIVYGMAKAKSQVSECFDRYRIPGRADVVLTVLRSGRPANVFVRGDFADSPMGNCVADAVSLRTRLSDSTAAR